MTRKERLWAILASMLITLVLEGSAGADGPCNGDAMAGKSLRAALGASAALTLRAGADGFQMLAFIEEGEAKLKDARESGRGALAKLTQAIDILGKDKFAEEEFKRMDERLVGLEYGQVAARLGIAPTVDVWSELTKAAAGGGKGWLRECVRSRMILRTDTAKFVEILGKMPGRQAIWSLMASWNRELARERYLTMILTE